MFSTSKSYEAQIPAGVHVAQITRAIVAQSRKGKQMLALRWTIVGKKSNWRDWIVLEPTRFGYGRLVSLCNAVGVVGAGDDPSGLNPHDQGSVLQHLLGKVCAVEVENETSEGDDRVFVNTKSVAYSALSEEQGIDLVTPPLPADAFEDWDGNVVGEPPPAPVGFSTATPPPPKPARRSTPAEKPNASQVGKPGDPNIPF